MKTSQKGISLIKNCEGLRLKAYRCQANKLTIGYGHTNNVRPDDVITQSEAEKLFQIDLAEKETIVNKLVKVSLTQGQYDSLVSFVYNGCDLANSTLLKKLNAKDYKGAAQEFLRWDKVPKIINGKVVRDANNNIVYIESEGLKDRRIKEQKLFLS